MKSSRPVFFLLLLLLSAPAAVRAGDAEGHESRGARIARWMEQRGVSTDAAIVAISTLPVVELRGAVPVGHLLHEVHQKSPAEQVKWSLWIFALAVAGNMIPIPFILLLLGPCSRFCMRVEPGRKLFEWLFARTRRKSTTIEKYEALGLTVFVAIPLPVTGGWTGAMAAFLMGIPFWKAMLYILLGVMIAGVIMTALSLLGWTGAVIAGMVLIGLAVGTLAKTFKPW